MDSVVNEENPGIKSRRTLFGTYNSQKKVELVGRIHADIFKIERMLPSGIDIRVTLIKEKPDFYMMGPNSHGANLSIDHKTINPEILYVCTPSSFKHEKYDFTI